MARHKFTPISPEYAEIEHPNWARKIWKWCVHCGCLKLGNEYFVPNGDHPKGILKAAIKRPTCSNKLSFR